MQLSVLIFTHNAARATLKRVLMALEQQSLDRAEWELIVVDNASHEPIADWLDLTWHSHATLLNEPQVGKTRAVLRGIEAAQGELLVFVDDDNLLEPDYLQKVFALAEQWPMLGAFGGRILAEFEQPPPEWTRRYWSYLTILDCPMDRWSNVPEHFEAVPPGAGLVVRGDVAQVYAELVRSDPLRISLDRTGQALISGGDTDLTFTACDLGYGVARFSSLALRHYMPAWRLTEEYLLKMVEGMAYSLHVLQAVRGKVEPATPRGRLLWQHLAGWKLPSRDRRFWHAQLRGRRRAERVVARCPELAQRPSARSRAIQAANRLGLLVKDQSTDRRHTEMQLDGGVRLAETI